MKRGGNREGKREEGTKCHVISNDFSGCAEADTWSTD